MSRGYPLGALFVVVTACAVLIAGAAPLVRTMFQEGTDVGRIVITTCAAAAWGMVVGLLVGLIGHRTTVASGLGALAGTVIGGAAGMISLLPARELAPVAAAMTAGSALIVGLALLMRRSDA
jgi:hypothetical protein